VSSVMAVQKYAALHATVRARYSTMLTTATWEALCRASDFDAVLGIIAETVYGRCLQFDRAELTPRRVIYEIKKHISDTCKLVIHSTPVPGRQLIVQLWRLFEVDNVKAVLRGVATGATWQQVRYVLFPLGSSAVLPAEEMLGTGDVNKAVDMLRGTPYYGVLSHALERYVAEQSLFPLEVALDLGYLRELWKDVKQLSGDDHRQAMRIVGTQVDVTNLLWAIRYRVYHHLSEEEIINYTVPFGYRVDDRDIRTIAAGGDIAEVIERTYPHLADVHELLREPREGLPELEVRLQRYIVGQCRSAFIGYPFHLGIPLAYVLLNEYEIQDLTVIIEAKAAQMPIEAFRSYLVIGHVRS